MNPNQPNHRINVPNVASGMFEPGIGFTLPSSLYLPILGPRTIAPARAADAPAACTNVDPAKSEKPSL